MPIIQTDIQVSEYSGHTLHAAKYDKDLEQHVLHLRIHKSFQCCRSGNTTKW